MTIHTIHARFQLERVDRIGSTYKAPGEQEAKAVEGAYVTLMPVQGEPFGSATPSGNIHMGIVNPTAAQHFFESPIHLEYDIVLFPRHEGKSHPVVAQLTGEETKPQP